MYGQEVNLYEFGVGIGCEGPSACFGGRGIQTNSMRLCGGIYMSSKLNSGLVSSCGISANSVFVDKGTAKKRRMSYGFSLALEGATPAGSVSC